MNYILSPDISLLIYIAPLGFIAFVVWRVRRHRRSLPQSTPRPDRTAQRSETIAMVGVSLALMTMLAMYRCYDGTPDALENTTPSSLRIAYWSTLTIWSSMILGILLLARYFNSVLGSLALILFFSIAGYSVNEGTAFSYKGHVENIREIPIPVEIRLAGKIQGADVWMNGVHVGKTPIQADLDDLLQRVPELEKPPEEWTDHNKFYRSLQGTFRPLAWFHLSPPWFHLSPPIDHESPKQRAIYARVELNGERMYSESIHAIQNGTRIFGQIEPSLVQLNMLLPSRVEDVAFLLQRARLADYEVDDAWLDAMERYDYRGWEALLRKSEIEPGFNRVLDQWAVRRYDLEKVKGHAAAMALLERIAAEAEERESYQTNSIAGRALELVLPEMEPEELIERAVDRIDSSVDRIDSSRSRGSWNSSHGIQYGRPFIATYPPQLWRKKAVTPADAVLAHVIMRLDIQYDQQDDTQDNPIEQRITPMLLRHSFPNSLSSDTAYFLGGSHVDRFTIRHNWRKRPPFEDYQDGVRVASNVEVNRWLHLATQLKSAAGREFRREHATWILQMTEKIVKESSQFQHSSFANYALDYLFLDVETDPDNLAVKFWPSYDSLATNQPHAQDQAIRARWDYLARMQPHCTPEMFAKVYRRFYDETRTAYGAGQVLKKLEPELHFQVLASVVEVAKELASHAKPGTSAHSVRQTNANELAQSLLAVPCDTAARKMVVWLKEDLKKQKNRMAYVNRLSQTASLSSHHLKRLIAADDPKIRRLVLPAIKILPTPEHRQILDTLLMDEDDSVSKEAVKLNSEFEELLSIPLPGQGEKTFFPLN